jgi:hypothetical protein
VQGTGDSLAGTKGSVYIIFTYLHRNQITKIGKLIIDVFGDGVTNLKMESIINTVSTYVLNTSGFWMLLTVPDIFDECINLLITAFMSVLLQLPLNNIMIFKIILSLEVLYTFCRICDSCINHSNISWVCWMNDIWMLVSFNRKMHFS